MNSTLSVLDFEFCILNFAFVIVLCVSALIFLIVWIAKGEPDTNGDPERDANDKPTTPLRRGARAALSAPISIAAPDPRLIALRNRVDEVIKPNPILEAEEGTRPYGLRQSSGALEQPTPFRATTTDKTVAVLKFERSEPLNNLPSPANNR